MSTGRSQSGGFAGSAVRKLLFWDFPRASWPYDVVVTLILVFIFVTPRSWFQDQPRADRVVLLSSTCGSVRVYIEPGLLENVPERLRPHRAAELIHQRTGKMPHSVHVEPIRDQAEPEVKGFIAYTTP